MGVEQVQALNRMIVDLQDKIRERDAAAISFEVTGCDGMTLTAETADGKTARFSLWMFPPPTRWIGTKFRVTVEAVTETLKPKGGD